MVHPLNQVLWIEHSHKATCWWHLGRATVWPEEMTREIVCAIRLPFVFSHATSSYSTRGRLCNLPVPTMSACICSILASCAILHNRTQHRYVQKSRRGGVPHPTYIRSAHARPTTRRGGACGCAAYREADRPVLRRQGGTAQPVQTDQAWGGAGHRVRAHGHEEHVEACAEERHGAKHSRSGAWADGEGGFSAGRALSVRAGARASVARVQQM